jgi:undecaprenyl-diphosphatase
VTVAGGVKAAAARGRRLSWPQWTRANVAAWGRVLVRAPRLRSAGPRFAWRAPLRLAVAALVTVAPVVTAMLFVDVWAIREVQRLPPWLVSLFDEASDFGKSGWFLVPTAVLLVAIAMVASPALPRMTRLVLAAISVRLGFVFLAVGIPGLLVAIVKRLVGRARPLVDGSVDQFLFRPFGWTVEYASLPSGHATTAGAAAFALGALWPRARPLFWAYAAVIMASRVVVTAHHPSDVVAGVAVGAFGALVVRDWFAVRRLAFVPDGAGGVRALPGPSFRRLRRVARALVAQ